PDAFVFVLRGHGGSTDKHPRGRCTFGTVAIARLGPMASWPPGVTGAGDRARLRFREAADRRLCPLLDPGPPLPGHPLSRGSAGPSRRPGHPGNRLPRIPPVHTADEAEAEGPKGGRGPRETDARGLSDATDDPDASAAAAGRASPGGAAGGSATPTLPAARRGSSSRARPV